MFANDGVALALISWITGLMACVEGLMSIPAGSTAMLANALIFLQLSINSAFALRATMGESQRGRWTVQLQGGVMMILGALVCAAVIRWSMMGSIPHPSIMIAIGAVAFLASLASWAIMLRNNRAPAGLGRLWEAGRSDAVSNVAVIAAGAAVALTRSNIPDLVIGGGMAALFVLSGWRVATTGRLDAGRAS
jgi:cobalt-zinc-cadmium efflux system protein